MALRHRVLLSSIQRAHDDLGNYTPLNQSDNVFVLLGGTFTRFSNDELLARYPAPHWYVKRVRRAADELAERDYITRRDRKALIEAAEAEPLYDFATPGR